MSAQRPRVVIVAEHASLAFGGEAALPLHWFRFLRQRGIEAWLVVHQRTRDELLRLLPSDADRIRFVPDTWSHILLWRVGTLLPDRIATATTGVLSSLKTQSVARKIVQRLIAEEAIDVVHEPIPVSPKHPSRMYDLGVPVVVGPLNGGMTFPHAFEARQGAFERLFLRVGRALSGGAHRLVPGKRRAATILVANARTRSALPRGVTGRVVEMIENGVDGSLWTERNRVATGPIDLVFLGRLVDWKAVDLLLRAFASPAREFGCRLHIVGDGPERERLRTMVAQLGVAQQVRFHGFVEQTVAAEVLGNANVLVLPSLFECGGAVVLEALASGVCVIATDWGGPADYVDATCGILVPPDGEERFVSGLEQAIRRLARDPEECRRLGSGGPRRIETLGVEWNQKVDSMLEIYRETIEHGASGNRSS